MTLPYQIICWMGGSRPDKRRNVSVTEKQIIHIIFKTNIKIHTSYWGGFFQGLSSARVIYNRARYDAHATMREMGR